MKHPLLVICLSFIIFSSCGGNDENTVSNNLDEDSKEKVLDELSPDSESEYQLLLENYELANTYTLTEMMEFGETQQCEFELFVLGPQGAAVTHYPEGKSIEYLSIEGNKFYIDGDVYNAYYLMDDSSQLELWDDEGKLASYTFEQN